MHNGELPKDLTELKHPFIEMDVTLVEIVVALYRYFGEEDKVNLWLKTNNPMFGRVKPLRLIQIGKAKSVLEFILEAERERGQL